MKRALLLAALALAGCTGETPVDGADGAAAVRPAVISLDSCTLDVAILPADAERAPLPQGFRHVPYFVVEQDARSATMHVMGVACDARVDGRAVGPTEAVFRGFMVEPPERLRIQNATHAVLFRLVASSPEVAAAFAAHGAGGQGDVRRETVADLTAADGVRFTGALDDARHSHVIAVQRSPHQLPLPYRPGAWYGWDEAGGLASTFRVDHAMGGHGKAGNAYWESTGSPLFPPRAAGTGVQTEWPPGPALTFVALPPPDA